MNEENNKVTVIGLGSSGVKIAEEIAAAPNVSWLDIWAIDTDETALDNCQVSNKILAQSGIYNKTSLT